MTQHPTRLSVLRTLDQAPGTPHEAWAVFADEADLLRFAQQHWRHVLDAAIDDALETGGGTLRDDVRAAYAGAASRHPGLRRLLDGHATHPAIARSSGGSTRWWRGPPASATPARSSLRWRQLARAACRVPAGGSGAGRSPPWGWRERGLSGPGALPRAARP